MPPHPQDAARALGAMPPHPQDAARSRGVARLAAPPGTPAMLKPGSDGPLGGPEARLGLPMPAVVNVTGALVCVLLPLHPDSGNGRQDLSAALRAAMCTD